MVDLAPHDIDVMRYLVDAEPIRIYAETERRIHTEHEDLFAGTIRFANGVIGVLNINWLTPTKRRKLTVTGERGMYVADYITQNLVFYANQEAAEKPLGRVRSLNVWSPRARCAPPVRARSRCGELRDSRAPSARRSRPRSIRTTA